MDKYYALPCLYFLLTTFLVTCKNTVETLMYADATVLLLGKLRAEHLKIDCFV